MDQKVDQGVREAVAVFNSEMDLQSAIDELLSHGFDRSEISLLASEEAIKNKLDHVYEPVRVMEDDPRVPTVAYVSPETRGDAIGAVIGGLIYLGAAVGIAGIVVSGGALATGIAAAALGSGAGAGIGAAVGSLIGKHHADYIDEQLSHGGLLLWVRTWDSGDERRAVSILKKHSGQDVHVHGLPSQNDPTLTDRYLGDVADAKREIYNDSAIVTTDDAVYAFGRIFSSTDEAKAYIDRRAYLEILHKGAKTHDFDLQAALIDPSSVFDTPAHLMSTGLLDRIKIDLLKRWAYDEKESEVASDDGMPAGTGDRLQEIEKLLMQLEGHPSG